MTEEGKISRCEWEEIQPFVESHLRENRITVDSFWEDHVLRSNHYKVTSGGQTAGYFAIHDKETLVLFRILEEYAGHAQEWFAKAKKYENVTNAMVVTGDEFFMSHCLDGFARIEKQAYFAIYTQKELPDERRKALTLRLADMDGDQDTLKRCEGFLDSEIEKIREGDENLQIYLAEHGRQVVGFGVIDYGRILRDTASIGMHVCEPYRRQGFAASLLQELKHIVQQKGCRAFSGCWYYNHNSKKSMESAGAYSKTRLVRFYF